MNKDVLHEHLQDFCRKVKAFEQFFLKEHGTHYDHFQNSVDKIFPHVGECEVQGHVCTYNFHGGGCRFSCDDFTVDYDFAPCSRDTIKISALYIRHYIESVTRITYARDDMERWLKQLVQDGRLQKPTAAHQYEINRDQVPEELSA